MKRLLFFSVLSVFSVFSATPPTWGEKAPRKLALDLPSGGRGFADEEESSPEIITFFGSDYEGESFYFLLDKSGSIDGEQLQLLKAELVATLNGLSTAAKFGMVAFSDNVVVFNPTPLPATPVRKAQGIGWVQSLVAAGSTGLLAGAMQLLDIAGYDAGAHKIIIVVGDGLPNIPGPTETLQGIIVGNYENLPFNTILFGSDPGATEFMQDLADATGGTFESNPL